MLRMALQVTVRSNNEVGVTLATVTAEDRDVGENATLRFSVKHCSDSDTPFHVTSLAVTSLNSTSALLTAAISFDHVIHAYTECVLAVCDSGAVTSLCADDVIVAVRVTPNDVSDRRPPFHSPTGGRYFTVPENQPAVTSVGT